MLDAKTMDVGYGAHQTSEPVLSGPTISAVEELSEGAVCTIHDQYEVDISAAFLEKVSHNKPDNVAVARLDKGRWLPLIFSSWRRLGLPDSPYRLG